MEKIVTEFVLIIQLLNYTTDSVGNSFKFYNRFNYMINIPNSFRTIYDIYQGYESNVSELYSDRVTEYVNIVIYLSRILPKVATDSEALRQMTNELSSLNYKFDASRAAELDSELIQFVSTPDSSSQSNQVSTTNYTLVVALTQYVAKATELKGFDIQSIKKGQSAANSSFNSDFGRLMNYMITNGEGQLLYYTQASMNWYLDEFDDKRKSTYRAIYIVLIIDPIVIVILMMMFVPFILRVQSHLLKIYLHLCKFKENEVRNWLEACNNSANDIKASTAQIRKTYGTTTFDITVIRDGEERGAAEESKAQPRVETTKNAHGTEEGKNQTTTPVGITTTSKQTDDHLLQTEEEKQGLAEMMRRKEDVLSERKQKMFSQMTRDKTKTYLLFLIFFATYIGTFRTADILVFSKIESDHNTMEDIFRVLVARDVYDALSYFMFREELRLNTGINQTNERDIVISAVNTYVNGAFDSEMAYSQSRAKMTGALADLQTYTGDIDNDQLCTKVFPSDYDSLSRTSQSITSPVECQTAYSGLALIGLNSVVLNALSYIKRTHSMFLLQYAANPKYALGQLESDEIVKMRMEAESERCR